MNAFTTLSIPKKRIVRFAILLVLAAGTHTIACSRSQDGRAATAMTVHTFADAGSGHVA